MVSAKKDQAADFEFSAWFEGSVLVDSCGDPMVVYHGTARTDPAWRPSRGAGMGGIYFTPCPVDASDLAEMDGEIEGDPPYVLPVYLAIKNPKVFVTSIDSQEFSEAQMREWERQGFDGVIGLRADGSIIEIAAFRLDQLVSTIDAKASPSFRAPERGASPVVREEAALKEWFAESKVVNEVGAPRVVYHGTPAVVRDFNTNVVASAETARLGTYFTANERLAKVYGENVIHAHLSLQNPFDIAGIEPIDAIEMLPVSDQLKRELRSGFRGAGVNEQYGLLESLTGRGLRDALEQAGFDGIKYTEAYSDCFIAFKSSQIRILHQARTRVAEDPKEALRAKRQLGRGGRGFGV